MKTLEIHELAEHIKEVLYLLQDRDESIEITYQGKIIARMVPASLPQKSNKQEIDAFLADMKEISAKVSAHVTEKVDAVQIVREGRRELLEPTDKPMQPVLREHSEAWKNLDRLAHEIGAHWPDNVTAVDAVRDVRREL